MEQNEAIADGSLNEYDVRPINVDTLGITNGCLDMAYEAPAYLQMANNNTYGVKTIPEDVFEEASHNVTKPGGCLDLITQCREAQLVGDPNDLGTNETVNAFCAGATSFCGDYVQGAYVTHSGVSAPLPTFRSYSN